MRKLFSLKKWLTLDEAVAHISTVLGEKVEIADLYRFALDDHLTLSVDFVNHAYARKGRRVKEGQIEFKLIEYNFFTKEKLDIPYKTPVNSAIRISEDDWIVLERPVVSISGVWDLTMFGAEKLDIEHYYQQLTSGLEVTLVSIDGVFLQQGDVVSQLQQDFDDNECMEGSKAQKKDLERLIITNKVDKKKEKIIWDNYNIARNKFLERRKDKPKEDNYFPPGGINDCDHVLVIRTNEIMRFLQSLDDSPSDQNTIPTIEKLNIEKKSLEVEVKKLRKQFSQYKDFEILQNNSYFVELINISIRALNEFPDWKKTQSKIQKSGNLQNWLVKNYNIQEREAEILKKILSEEFPELN